MNREERAKEICKANEQQCFNLECKDCTIENKFLPVKIADYIEAEVRGAYQQGVIDGIKKSLKIANLDFTKDGDKLYAIIESSEKALGKK